MNTVLDKCLKEVCFVQRGSAYFRVHGREILQVIKFDKRHDGTVNLNMGLFSMYSKLLPQWFTSRGCIPRYSVGDLIENHIEYPNMQISQRDPFVGSQVELMIHKGIPWLDSMDTQKNLLTGLSLLEKNRSGKINWIDELKFAPFLVCEDYCSAEKVISSILEQHHYAKKINKSAFSNPDAYIEYVNRINRNDAYYLLLLEMVQQQNVLQIRKYLEENYLNNSRYARFCLQRFT